MGGDHQASLDRPSHKRLAKANHYVQHEYKEVQNGTAGEDQDLSDDDELRINEVEAPKSNHDGGVAPLPQQVGSHKQQQQPLAPIIRWERFLPVRTLKVLLVENDDSTRHVVSSLLRNCSYEVTAVANGLQAWKILEDLPNHVDLVLTEVVMPCLSGIGLLSKIMSHKTWKNIPVIMMSSNDSMGTVFKCLSKGAVDFLVKPIRKNELKNLWQHVWRRCHSSSGSGSESGIQTQKCTKSNSADDSANNSDSNNDDDNESIELNVRDGSDNGSGTQSSWTKRAVEVESSQPMSPSDQLADPPDSTCAQVIHPKPEIFCNEWFPMTTNRSCQGQEEFSDDLMGKDLEIGVPRNMNAHCESYPTDQASTKLTFTTVDKMPESDLKNEEFMGLEGNNTSEDLANQAADLIGAIAKGITDAQQVARVAEAPNGFSNNSEGKDEHCNGFMELPSLELSLKRLRSTGEGITAAQDDRNILKRSDLSAFKRYHTSAGSNQELTGCGGSYSPLDNSSDAVKTESTNNMLSNSNAAPINQGSNGSSNNNDMGSTTKNAFTKPAAYKENTSAPSAGKSIQHASAFRPVRVRSSPTPNAKQDKIDEVTVTTVTGEPKEIQRQVQVQHHHHHYHHHHHHVHSMQQQQPPDHSAPKNMAAEDPQCGSSNVLTGPGEGNVENVCVVGSNSVSNHGNNGQNGSSIAGGLNTDSANDIATGARGGNGSGSGSGSCGVDQNRLAQREAALNKFRQKRKERNFGKKVLYHSRKRLAEQRPRVRGQFVRQAMHEQTGREEDR
ncbi:two-component response regulator-like PRR37 [Typha latifolia]|uniref:two-component response regulator-like PRR37 n=1 Tax=Typha latifolia TaxID=4733 RepID=UPI003C2C03A5